MARALLIWELGAGLGHLVNLKPFAEGLAARGHQVFAALQDFTLVDRVFSADLVTCLDPPRPSRETAKSIDACWIARPFTFAHILHNSGFGDLTALRVLVDGWRRLFNQIRPDVVIIDHSPVALLAARSANLPRCLIGTGFFSPPAVSPLPNLRTGLPCDVAALVRDEQRVLSHANSVLAEYGEPPLGKIADLYTQVHHNFLATFPELDHFGARADGDYVGAWPLGIGAPPEWPLGRGRRVFAYLKAEQFLPELLAELHSLATPTLVYGPEIPQELRTKYAASHLRFSSEPLDMRRLGQECDLAILNGNHGTTTAMLLAGKPTVQVPKQLEQALFSQVIQRLGAGVVMSADNAKPTPTLLREALEDAELRTAAERFAARHADFDVAASIEKMIDMTAELAPSSLRASPAQSREPIARVEPSELVHFKRFDVMGKTLYGQHRCWKLHSRWAERIYLTHLNAFNGFVEIQPKKENPQEFVAAFDRVLDSIAVDGFDPQQSVIPVGSDGAILNGAHRLAACLVYQTPIVCQHHPYPGFDFSAAWFRRRGSTGDAALPTICADAMAVEYAERQARCRLLLICGGDKLDDELFARARRAATVVYARRFRWPSSAVANILRLALARGWQPRPRLSGVTDIGAHDAGDARILLVEPSSSESLNELMNEWREMDPDAIITATSSHAATREASSSLLNPNAPALFESLPPNELPRILDQLDRIGAELATRGIPLPCVCVTRLDGMPLVTTDRPRAFPTYTSGDRPWRLMVGGRFADECSLLESIEVAPNRSSNLERTGRLRAEFAGKPLDVGLATHGADDAIADTRLHASLAGLKLLAGHDRGLMSRV